MLKKKIKENVINVKKIINVDWNGQPVNEIAKVKYLALELLL